MVDDEDNEEPLEVGWDVEGVQKKKISSTCPVEVEDLHSRPAVAVEAKGKRLLVTPTIPPPSAPSPQPPVTDSHHAAPSSQLNADSSHASQQVVQIPITWDEKGFDPDNNVCTQAISGVIELMLNEPWINYSEIPANVQNRWFDKWAEQKKHIRKAYDYRAGRRYQQIMRDVLSGELQRLKWLSELLRRQLLHRFADDPGFKKHSAVNKVNRASSKGGKMGKRSLRSKKRNFGAILTRAPRLGVELDA
ncbi:hypothetical protein PIB30_085009 [Stylosanthes scabra]|uniref:Uncharacterized protein n=1 Tax=Stylosanthes scabra TaxID=79078 RepID=A0ABU6TS88_9FABA|nr:hypothetical protein [Stylosanthes scabra]